MCVCGGYLLQLLELAIPALTPLLFKLLYVLVRSMNTKWRAPRDPRVTPPPCGSWSSPFLQKIHFLLKCCMFCYKYLYKMARSKRPKRPPPLPTLSFSNILVKIINRIFYIYKVELDLVNKYIF